MGKGKLGRAPRDKLKHAYRLVSSENHGDETFTPTICVVRKVDAVGWDDKKAYAASYQRAMRLAVNKNQWKNHRLSNPYELGLVQFHQGPLANHIRTYKRFDKRKETVELLASILQDKLHENLKPVPSTIPMKTGNITSVTFPETTKNNSNHTAAHVEIVSMLPSGWRGLERKRKHCETESSFNTAGQLAVESLLYRDAISEVCEWLAPETVVLDPVMPLLRRQDGYPVDTSVLKNFQNLVAEDTAAPTEFPLSDPVIIVQMGRYRRDRYELPGRIPAEELYSPLAA
ncbi:MAG: hypothetical protein QFB86_04485 [Patescibacteria group bacterium]|nr:hypothetical protein [Patescibacteria group bacterium]